MEALELEEFSKNNDNLDWELDNTHYVSKFILKRFVPRGEKSGKLVVYDKLDECFSFLPPKEAASKPGFYTVGAEKELGKVESKAAQILKRKLLKSIGLSQAEDDILRLFTLQMMGRGPGMRKELQKSDSDARGKVAELRIRLALQGIIKESPWWDDKVERGIAASALWCSDPKMSPSRALIQRMERRVFILPDQFPLVIGDNPCMFIHHGRGLKALDCELALALSPFRKGLDFGSNLQSPNPAGVTWCHHYLRRRTCFIIAGSRREGTSHWKMQKKKFEPLTPTL